MSITHSKLAIYPHWSNPKTKKIIIPTNKMPTMLTTTILTLMLTTTILSSVLIEVICWEIYFTVWIFVIMEIYLQFTILISYLT